MSNEKEQFARFSEIVEYQRCENCPVCIKCHEESLVAEQIPPTCAETLWHYVKTGEFLL